MLRKITFLSLAAILAIGVSSYTLSSNGEKPKKTSKSTAKKTAPKKAAETQDKEEAPGVLDSTKITWYSMTKGYAKAKKEKKFLVIDVYTDWCYWCKVMDKNTYENSEIIKRMNEYTVAVKFNPEVNGKHIINKDTMSSSQLATYLAKGGRIPGYPMTFIWKGIADNSTIKPYSGYIEPAPFYEILNKTIAE
ncbi:MAG TPA: DUF255 domain-containing protein [Bacteroidia bacterium]